MNKNVSLDQGRYLLFLDILGFSELVETKSTQEIYAVIDNALKEFGRWEELNGLFKTIYFSDTFIFYQEPKGYGRWAFLDVYAIGGMVLSALLAAGIPARGAISFGEFEVNLDATGRHQVYFGKALIEAYKAEQREKWIGITILPSAWKPYEAAEPGIIDAFSGEKVWSKRDDDVLLLNPFIKLRGWYMPALMGEVNKPYSKWDAPEFPNDILGFKFIREQAAHYAAKNDFTSAAAIKYHTTIRFLENILGEQLYKWGTEASLPGNF
ncbi:hypothetical protein SAMN04244579_04414 [Azotobacter beijerinckii]|uniref:Guanylate cyclase domain-containing protein n=1 Tax=Azotobacter beijerinckii TaxID=170623 RepID=A0A1H6YTQ5_9GAMM|nr:hypothetical protein [Azotobacter beijerinckii]SEJ44629.1 hypothetical protein SAMN04244579_04414 [Azotobacter beijerinckii]